MAMRARLTFSSRPSRQSRRSTDGAAAICAECAPSSEPSSSTLAGVPTHSKKSATRPSS